MAWPLVSGTALAQESPVTTTTMLPEIVVTATRFETDRDKVGSAIAVITAEDLENRQVRLVSEALRDVPGLAVGRSGGVGTLTQVRIRGAEGNHTLVIIDGIEVNDPSRGSEFDFSNLLASDVERIEILRGPQSALYGSDAIGGVINIITKRGRGRPRVTGSMEYGSFATYQGTVGVRGGGESYRFAFDATRYHTGGISAAAGDRGNPENDSYDQKSASVRLGLSPTDFVDLDLVGRFNRTYVESDGFTGGVGAVDNGSATEGRERFGRAQATVTLFDGMWEHIAGVSASEQNRDNLTNKVEASHSDGFKSRYDYRTNLYLDTEGPVPAGHTLTFGYEREREKVISQSAFTNVDRVLDCESLYGQYRIALWDRLFLTGGVRQDFNDDLFGDARTWRATVAYLLAETGTRFKGSWGTGFKAPTVFELFGFTANFRGNPNLRPEESRGWDAGIEQSLLNGRIRLDLTYFHNRIRNLISGAGQTAVNLDGVTETEGIEFSAHAGIIDGLDAVAAYTWTSTRDPDGSSLVRRPKHIASFNLNYRFWEDRANLGLGVDYNGRQRDFAFDAAFNRSRVTLDGYTLVSVTASVMPHENVELFARAENLLDEDYEEVFTYGTPGRAGYVGLRVGY